MKLSNHCLFVLLLMVSSSFAFVKNVSNNSRQQQQQKLIATTTSTTTAFMTASETVAPIQQDAKDGRNNMAQYLVDLHDSQATFDFCGGMMFQLVLSDALREHLAQVAREYDDYNNSNTNTNAKNQVLVHGPTTYRMHQMENYVKSAHADNLALFHGREIRRVPWAKGGMGFVLQLSLANGKDPQGWTAAEIAGYDGWGHDVGRTWRTGTRLQEEGFVNFPDQFGPDAFALHHRFYLHWDVFHRLWLSAEDGCEGTPVVNVNPFQSIVRGWIK